MEKLDLVKLHKKYYTAKTAPEIVDIEAPTTSLFWAVEISSGKL